MKKRVRSLFRRNTIPYEIIISGRGDACFALFSPGSQFVVGILPDLKPGQSLLISIVKKAEDAGHDEEKVDIEKIVREIFSVGD